MPGLFRVGGVVDLGRVAVPLGPAQVHPLQALRPVGCVRAARLRVDRDQRLTGVVLAGQQGADLQLVDLLAQAGQVPGRPPRVSAGRARSRRARTSPGCRRAAAAGCPAGQLAFEEESRRVTACACSWSSQSRGRRHAPAGVGLLAHRLRIEDGFDAGELGRQFRELVRGVGSCHAGKPTRSGPAAIRTPRRPGRPPGRPRSSPGPFMVSEQPERWTRVRTARTATDSVATVKRSLSQISVSVSAARSTAGSFRCTQPASRSSGHPPAPVTIEHVPGQRGVRGVQVVAQRRSGHRVPSVVPGQRDDPVPQPGDLQPVGELEVDLRGLLDRPRRSGDLHDVERGVRGNHRGDLFGQLGGDSLPVQAARRSSNPAGRCRRAAWEGRTNGETPGEEVDRLGDPERRPPVTSSQRVARSVSLRPRAASDLHVVPTGPSMASTWSQKAGMW